MQRNFEKELEIITEKIMLEPGNKEYRLEQANLFSELGILEKALNSIDEVLKIDPGDETALLLKAEQLLKMNKPLESLEFIDIVLAGNEANSQAWVQRALVNIDLNKMDEVKVSLDKAVSLDPKNTDCWLKKYEVHKFLNDKKGMWDSLHQIRVLAPQKVELWIDQGELLIESGKLDQALSYYESLLNTGYRKDFLLAKKADILLRLKNVSEAIKYLDEALAINSNCEEALVIKGSFLLGTGKMDSAKELFDQALEINQECVKGLMGKAEYYLADKQLLKAKHLYDRVTDLSPCFSPAWFKKGIVNEVHEKNEDALFCYTRAFETNRTYLPAIRNKLQLLFRTNRFIEANACCDIALGLRKDDKEYLKIKADCLKFLHKYNEIIEINNKILSFEPDNNEALEQIALALYSLGRKNDAIEALTMLLEKEPDRKELWLQLAEIYSMDKDHAKVIETINKALEIDPSYKEAIQIKNFAEKESKITKGKFIDTLEKKKIDPKELKLCPMCGTEFVGKFCTNCDYAGEAPLASTVKQEEDAPKPVTLIKKKRKRKSMELHSMLLMIWFQPRTVVRTLLDIQPRRMFPAFFIIYLGAFLDLITGLFSQPEGSGLGLAISIFVGSLVFAFFAAIAQFYTLSPVIRLLGKFVGGKASSDEIRIALAGANLTKVTFFIWTFLFALLFGGNMSPEIMMSQIQNNGSMLGILFIYGTGFLILLIWYLIVFMLSIAEAHQISTAKAIIIAIIIFLILGVIIGGIIFLLIMSIGFLTMLGGPVK